MPTTSGSFALKGLEASMDGAVATALREAGCIILAKTNLSVRKPYAHDSSLCLSNRTGMGQQQRIRSHERLVGGRRTGMTVPDAEDCQLTLTLRHNLLMCAAVLIQRGSGLETLSVFLTGSNTNP